MSFKLIVGIKTALVPKQNSLGTGVTVSQANVTRLQDNTRDTDSKMLISLYQITCNKSNSSLFIFRQKYTHLHTCVA